MKKNLLPHQERWGNGRRVNRKTDMPRILGGLALLFLGIFVLCLFGFLSNKLYLEHYDKP